MIREAPKGPIPRPRLPLSTAIAGGVFLFALRPPVVTAGRSFRAQASRHVRNLQEKGVRRMLPSDDLPRVQCLPRAAYQAEGWLACAAATVDGLRSCHRLVTPAISCSQGAGRFGLVLVQVEKAHLKLEADVQQLLGPESAGSFQAASQDLGTHSDPARKLGAADTAPLCLLCDVHVYVHLTPPWLRFLA